LLSLPTGGGKTIVMSALIAGAVAKGKRVVFITHRRNLVYQARDRLAAYGISCGIVMGSEPRTGNPVQVCSVQTLVRRQVPADIAIADECHHATSPMWQRVLNRYAIVCGCTATPYRLDGAPLGSVFGAIVHGPTVADLVADGILVSPRIFAPAGPDLTGVHIRAGEFVPSELEEAVSKPGLIGDIYSTWLKRAKGLKTIGFAVGVQHSKACAALWGDRGRHIDGSTPQAEREEAVEALEKGVIDALWNCSLVDEGFDLPSLECAVLARPTASLALHRQQIGRVMRASPLKDGAIVLDHSGNVRRHGLPTDEVEVSLTGKAKRKQEAAPRMCAKCFAVCDSYPCWSCGHIPEPEVREIKVTDGELVEVPQDSQEQRRQWYATQIKVASDLGYKIGYAKFRFKQRYSVWPRFKQEDEKYVCTGHAWEQRQWGIVCARCLRARSPELHPA